MKTTYQRDLKQNEKRVNNIALVIYSSRQKTRLKAKTQIFYFNYFNKFSQITQQ